MLIDCRGETALLVRFYRVNVKLGFPCGCRGFSSPFCLQASETVAVKFLLPSNPDLGSHRSFLGVAERRSEMQGGGDSRGIRQFLLKKKTDSEEFRQL